MNGQVGNLSLQRKPSKFKRAIKATGKFFRNTLLAGIISASVLAPSVSKAADNYKMPVIVNERSHVKYKENFTPEMKSLVPQMVSEGIFADEQAAYDALATGNFNSYLKEILYTDNQALKDAFASGVTCSNITNFTDFQGSFSFFHLDTTSVKPNWSFAWNEVLGIALSPTRLNIRRMQAQQVYPNPADTVDNYSDIYTSTYVPIAVFSTSFITKLGSDYTTYDWSASYSPKLERNLEESFRLQATNVGKRYYISFDYLMASKIGADKWIVDAGVSAGLDYARAVVWIGDLTSPKPYFAYGLQVTPNVFFSEDVNNYFNMQLYSMLKNQQNQTGIIKDVEITSGVRFDFNLFNSAILGTTIEYNSGAPNDKFAQKPTGMSYWVNLSVPLRDL